MSDFTRMSGSSPENGAGGRPSTINLKPGDLLHGEYQVVKQVGIGGAGVVYKCKALSLGNLQVAVKVLPDSSNQNPSFINRLSREVLASHMIDHPNVTRFYDCIRDGQFITIVFEFVEGGTLEQRIVSPNYTLNQAILWLAQIASGLTAIHQAGIVHRDLKPTNILIGRDLTASITDFGVVTAIGEDCIMRDLISSIRSEELNFRKMALPSHRGAMVGTPFYSSPEYLESNQFDQRLDIYSFGVIAYQLVTGTSPFKAENLFELVESKLHDDPVPPASLSEKCPRVLNNLIMQAMARDPQRRIQSAAELSERLRHMLYAGSRSTNAYSMIENTVQEQSTYRPVNSTATLRQRQSVATSSLALVFYIMLVATVFSFMSHPEQILIGAWEHIQNFIAQYR